MLSAAAGHHRRGDILQQPHEVGYIVFIQQFYYRLIEFEGNSILVSFDSDYSLSAPDRK